MTRYHLEKKKIFFSYKHGWKTGSWARTEQECAFVVFPVQRTSKLTARVGPISDTCSLKGDVGFSFRPFGFFALHLVFAFLKLEGFSRLDFLYEWKVAGFGSSHFCHDNGRSWLSSSECWSLIIPTSLTSVREGLGWRTVLGGNGGGLTHEFVFKTDPKSPIKGI